MQSLVLPVRHGIAKCVGLGDTLPSRRELPLLRELGTRLGHLNETTAEGRVRDGRKRGRRRKLHDIIPGLRMWRPAGDSGRPSARASSPLASTNLWMPPLSQSVGLGAARKAAKPTP